MPSDKRFDVDEWLVGKHIKNATELLIDELSDWEKQNPRQGHGEYITDTMLKEYEGATLDEGKIRKIEVGGSGSRELPTLFKRGDLVHYRVDSVASIFDKIGIVLECHFDERLYQDYSGGYVHYTILVGTTKEASVPPNRLLRVNDD